MFACQGLKAKTGRVGGGHQSWFFVLLVTLVMGGCKWPGCPVKAPRYTCKGQKPYRGEYCLKHAKCFYPSRDLVNMNLPQCKAPPYCDERAKWGRKEEDGTARATACELHREEGMVVGGHRYCRLDPMCLSRAHFAYPWSDKLEYSCRKHALPNMLRVDSQAYKDARQEYEVSERYDKGMCTLVLCMRFTTWFFVVHPHQCDNRMKGG